MCRAEKLELYESSALFRLTARDHRVGMAPFDSAALPERLMHRFWYHTAALALALLPVLVPARARAEEPIGMWATQQADAHIKLAKCGRALCATVAWLKDSIDAKTGRPPVDSNNPDPAKRGRKILGMRIFAMEPDGHGAYTGDIYNADDGKIYKGRLVPRGTDDLEVQGCNASNLCGFELWTRINEASSAAASDQNKK